MPTPQDLQKALSNSRTAVSHTLVQTSLLSAGGRDKYDFLPQEHLQQGSTLLVMEAQHCLKEYPTLLL